MFQETIYEGRVHVVISANTDEGPFYSRLYVGGDTATLLHKKAKTLEGARTQARAMILSHNLFSLMTKGKVIA